MKICTRCHKEYPEGRFCLECGGELGEKHDDQNESGSKISLGDKNVVAGDIIGRKDEYKITGSATIIKNEDETRKIINCNVCGKTELITDSVRCPSCLNYVCKDHYNLKARRCSNCDKNAENEYRNILEQVLADGKIELDERMVLDTRAKVFKISPERALEIENEFKNQVRKGKTVSLNTIDKIEFSKIKKEIATVKDLIPIFERIGRLYTKYPDNEEIKRRYFQLGPYALGMNFKEKLKSNFDDFYAEFAKIEIEILQNRDLRAAIDILDYVKKQYSERELDNQAKELDILYRFYETEGDDYIEAIEDLLKDILKMNWNESDYACFILYKIFTDKKIVFQDEALNGWEVNLTSINADDNILIQLFLQSTQNTKKKSDTYQTPEAQNIENEYLNKIFIKCKADGYFTKFESYDAFKAYFHNEESYKKLWDFLILKNIITIPSEKFMEIIQKESFKTSKKSSKKNQENEINKLEGKSSTPGISTKSTSESLNQTRIEDVKIGNQVWMKQNLNVDKFRNGDPITHAKTNEEWDRAGNQGKPAWCFYENDGLNGKKYGRLYNWYAVNDPRGLAPKDYHVPSDQEWKKLVKYLGGVKKAQTLLKGRSGWSEYGGGTDEVGFSGLPGGYRGDYGSFQSIGLGGYWWSASTDSFGTLSLYWGLWWGDTYMDHGEHCKKYGLSVRCLRDF